MISKGKRRYLVNLFMPDGFFYRGNTLCFKMGNQILVNMIPAAMHAVQGTIAFTEDICLDFEDFKSNTGESDIAGLLAGVLKKNGDVAPFDSSKISRWGQPSNTQFGYLK